MCCYRYYGLYYSYILTHNIILSSCENSLYNILREFENALFNYLTNGYFFNLKASLTEIFVSSYSMVHGT